MIDYLDWLINRVEIMLIIIVLGLILRKIKVIDENLNKVMGRVMLEVITPLTIFSSFVTEYSNEKLKALGIGLLVAVIIHAASIILAFIIFRRKYTVEKFCAVLGNVGFFGIAIALSVCGNEAAFYGGCYVAVNAFVMWTYGIYLMSRDKSYIKIKKIMTNPNVLAIIIGLVFFFTGLRIPSVCKDAIDSLSTINSPVCGLIIGAGLIDTKIGKIKDDIAAIISIVTKLILAPLLAAFVLSFVSNDYYLMKVFFIIVSAVPTASAATIFALNYHQDVGKAAKIVSISTLLCIFTMPLMTKVAFIIWGL